MKYSFSGRVRYSEIGENGLLTLPGVLNYNQDIYLGVWIPWIYGLP